MCRCPLAQHSISSFSYGGGGTRFNLSRPVEVQRFFRLASLQDVKDAVASGRLNPKATFGSESILDAAIVHISNLKPDKAQIIKYLADNGADVNHSGKVSSVLCRAVRICRADVVEVLLDAGAVNAFNDEGLKLSAIASANPNLQGSEVLSRIRQLGL